MFKGFVREGELRRWAPWGGATLLILAAVALQISMESVCWDETTFKAAKINEAVGCFEFWFNRYQTLIGAIAALAGAGIAWIGVRKQIDKADEQISVASRQSSIAILPVLDQRTESAIKAFRSAVALEAFHFDMYRVSGIAFARTKDAHKRYHSSERWPQLIGVIRESFVEYKSRVDAFDGCLGEMTKELARGLGGPSFRQAGQDLWICAINILNTHRAALTMLAPFAADKIMTKEELFRHLAEAASFDDANFGVLDGIYAKSLEEISKEVMIMQTERDRIFDQSRS
ncbi:hypothetical protein [Methylobacterium sp. GXF4]|uniref:hypothetical protein n=1 Tax=Methylobacterium sp. GXF4 TaxID=1096546 RepID=UPI000FFE47C6|nr:hypothetical protein [Methylobacterium sp. GXF4]